MWLPFGGRAGVLLLPINSPDSLRSWAGEFREESMKNKIERAWLWYWSSDVESHGSWIEAAIMRTAQDTVTLQRRSGRMAVLASRMPAKPPTEAQWERLRKENQ